MPDSSVRWAFFGHHKCATNWINRVIGAVCRRLSIRQMTFNDWLLLNPSERPQGELFCRDFIRNAVENGVEFVSFTDCNQRTLGHLRWERGFHVIRDPRDLAVSAYFSHRYSHTVENLPVLAQQRLELERLSKTEGFLLVLGSLAGLMSDLETWNYKQPTILELRWEQLVRDPFSGFSRIIRFLGLNSAGSGGKVVLGEDDLLDVLKQFSFQALSRGRQPGEEDPASHYRKGVPGDWVNHFEPMHKLYFQRHYPQLLSRLGYEEGADW